MCPHLTTYHPAFHQTTLNNYNEGFSYLKTDYFVNITYQNIIQKALPVQTSSQHSSPKQITI